VLSIFSEYRENEIVTDIDNFHCQTVVFLYSETFPPQRLYIKVETDTARQGLVDLIAGKNLEFNGTMVATPAKGRMG